MSDQIIQIALIPVDTETKKLNEDLAIECLVKCPSYENLLPQLNPWVKKHNKELIKKAHKEGIKKTEIVTWFECYFDRPDVQEYFQLEKEKIVLLGKSLSALDIPILIQTIGKAFIDKYFHHHTIDVTSVARYLVDAGQLPVGYGSGQKLVKHFRIREKIAHTAMEDAVDMAKIYLELLDLLKALGTS